ncbi:MAG TPA: hypothetical protein VKY74_03340 [Chloroflexia bacterium]|nr:hypothetical protein [Chloroflexia bacterium]
MNAQDTIRQLSLIRYLFTQARDQICQPYPQSIAAILTLHDCVELFLDLASQQPGVIFNINKPQPNFLDYWQMQLPQGGNLTQKTNMDKLNRVRVNFKHAGIWPAGQELDPLFTRVSDFLEENTPVVFGRDFNSFSMVDLVELPSSRQQLQQAEAFLKAEQITAAMDAIAYAFEDLILDRRRKEQEHARQRPILEEYLVREALKEQDKFRNAAWPDLQIIGWGLDYPRYLHFQAISPEITWTDEDNRRAIPWRSDSPSVEEGKFCFNFVIDSALRLQSLPTY